MFGLRLFRGTRDRARAAVRRAFAGMARNGKGEGEGGDVGWGCAWLVIRAKAASLVLGINPPFARFAVSVWLANFKNKK